MIGLNEQMEFSALISALEMQPAAAKMQRKPRHAEAVALAAPEDFAVILLRAVTEENLIFSYYAVMMAVQRREDATLAGVSIECGYSYHATRHIVTRTHYLEKVDSSPVGLKLTKEGVEKLAKISKRLARYV